MTSCSQPIDRSCPEVSVSGVRVSLTARTSDVQRDELLVRKVVHRAGNPVVDQLARCYINGFCRSMPVTNRILPSCSILILAGGRGQRMGGQDKGLVEWHGRPLVSWLHGIVRPMTDDLIISCNRNQQRYAGFADRLVGDQEQDFPGPLAGIRAAVRVARHPWLLVLPCDAPRIDRTLLAALHQLATTSPGRPAMVRRGNQWEPLFCMIPTNLAPELERVWDAGERSIRRVLLEFEPRSLELAEDDPRLANLNSPELLAEQHPDGGT